jgi:hypothetical protein
MKQCQKKKKKKGQAPDVKDYNIKRPMRFVCFTITATETTSEHVTIIVFFHGKNGYANVPQCYVIIILVSSKIIDSNVDQPA